MTGKCLNRFKDKRRSQADWDGEEREVTVKDAVLSNVFRWSVVGDLLWRPGNLKEVELTLFRTFFEQ